MRLLTPGQTRELDRISMAELDIPGKRLMGNAGRRVAEKALELTSDIHDPAILILCGKGNNGGDGFAAAVILNEQNYQIQIHSIPYKKEIKNDSLHYYLKCEGLGIPVTFGSHIPEFKKPDLVIDGLLGTGFKGELRKDLIPWVDWINDSDKSDDEFVKQLNEILDEFTIEFNLRRLDIQKNTIESSFILQFSSSRNLDLLILKLREKFPAIGITFIDQNQLPSV